MTSAKATMMTNPDAGSRMAWSDFPGYVQPPGLTPLRGMFA
jgi:hypothetical protein